MFYLLWSPLLCRRAHTPCELRNRKECSLFCCIGSQIQASLQWINAKCRKKKSIAHIFPFFEKDWMCLTFDRFTNSDVESILCLAHQCNILCFVVDVFLDFYFSFCSFAQCCSPLLRFHSWSFVWIIKFEMLKSIDIWATESARACVCVNMAIELAPNKTMKWKWVLQ